MLVTAYMNYALDGYKVKASRFLLKDELEQTLPECVDDILKEIRQNNILHVDKEALMYPYKSHSL